MVRPCSPKPPHISLARIPRRLNLTYTLLPLREPTKDRETGRMAAIRHHAGRVDRGPHVPNVIDYNACTARTEQES
jgi:hypothetical protein